MNWYKATLNEIQVNELQDRFRMILSKLPRPQKTFLYERESNNLSTPIGKNELYFSPECILYMKDLLNEFNAAICEIPDRSELICLCGIEDFEDLIWS